MPRDPSLGTLQCNKSLFFHGFSDFFIPWSGWGRYAAPALQHDLQLVLRAAQQDGRALEFAAPRLRQHKPLVLAACAQHGPVKHRQPVQCPPFGETVSKSRVQRFTVAFHCRRKRIEVPVINVLDAKRLPDVVTVVKKKHRKKLGHGLPRHLPLI